MNRAAEVFGIPELFELILLNLPVDTTYSEIATTRTMYNGQTICRTWHYLVLNRRLSGN